MTKVLDFTAKPAAPAPTQVKKAHDPAEVKRHETILQRLMHECMEGFANEMNGTPDQPNVVKRDAQAVKAHYAERWREQARTLNASGFPHQVDEELVAKEIDSMMQQAENLRKLNMPIYKVDPADYDLLPVGRTLRGVLHINNVCAVALHEGGLTTVWLRHAEEPLEIWAQGWMNDPERLPLLEAPEFTVQQLMNLLGAVGVARWAPLPEALMGVARTPPKRNWWQRITNTR